MTERTATLYLPGSTDASESFWEEQARWERLAIEDRGGTVTNQTIHYDHDPRIETDFDEKETG